MVVVIYITFFYFYYRQNFDEEPIFRAEIIDETTSVPTENVEIPEQLEISSNDFQIATQSHFDKFMMEIEVSFCLCF